MDGGSTCLDELMFLCKMVLIISGGTDTKLQF